MKKKILHRAFMFAFVLLLGGLSLLSCCRKEKLQTERGDGPGAKTESDSSPTYKGSPMLRSRVESGELPPLEKRLPEEPLVITPPDGVGRYDSSP